MIIKNPTGSPEPFYPELVIGTRLWPRNLSRDLYLMAEKKLAIGSKIQADR